MLDMFTQCLLAGVALGVVLVVLKVAVIMAARQRTLIVLMAAIIVGVLAFAVWPEAPGLVPLLTCYYTVLSVALGTGELLVPLVWWWNRNRPKRAPAA